MVYELDVGSQAVWVQIPALLQINHDLGQII